MSGGKCRRLGSFKCFNLHNEASSVQLFCVQRKVQQTLMA